MNKKRRKSIEEIIDKLDQIKEMLECISGDEQEAYDNIPENLNNSELANAMYENIDDIENAVNTIDDVIETLNDVIYK